VKILLNLAPRSSPNGKKWLKPSKLLALVIREALEAVIMANRLYLRTHKVPPIYESGIRYEEEPAGQPYEDFAAIPVVLSRGWGDCMPSDMFLLRDDYEPVPVADIEPGQRIWGHNRWSTVEAKVDKGSKSVDAIHLNNGSTVKLTPEHDMFVWGCEQHPASWLGHSMPCRCPLSQRRKVKVGDLEPSMVLEQPERIALGEGDLDVDRAYVEGLYLSDGWVDGTKRFCISGRDGHPKEAQKRRVESICNKLGLHTRWNEKYIAVNDSEWTVRLTAMGRGAPNKRALSLDLPEGPARALLAGILADSGKNKNGGSTFTTTSRLLAIQTRVLLRMTGIAASYRYIEDHGGLGQNPIHRLGIREPSSKGAKLLRVKEVTRSVGVVPCHDIQTDDHFIYLPEHDVTVSNCDDLVAWRISELRNAGENAKVRLKWQYDPVRAARMYHVLVRRSNGQVEDPSKRLGMGTHQAARVGVMTP
jgi:hypothetical protein